MFFDDQGNQRYAHAPDVAAQLVDPAAAVQIGDPASQLGQVLMAPMAQQQTPIAMAS